MINPDNSTLGELTDREGLRLVESTLNVTCAELIMKKGKPLVVIQQQ